VAIVALVLLVGVFGLNYYFSRTQVTLTVAEVEAELRSGISAGDSRSRVESFLDQKGIAHAYIEKSKWPEETRTEFALIRNTSRSALIRGDIQVRFKFDEKDRLETYTVKEILTGP
jgi:hypothetical protein